MRKRQEEYMGAELAISFPGKTASRNDGDDDASSPAPESPSILESNLFEEDEQKHKKEDDDKVRFQCVCV